MKFAIIAAGEGSRLAQEGVEQPKPLVRVAGETLVERLVRIFNANGAEEVIVIVNELRPETAQFVRAMQQLPQNSGLRLVVKTTPSSMHSFYEISNLLADGPFCLTTVDTIFKEDEFSAYIEAFRRSQADGFMAVTDFVDDEKPLYVATDDELAITGFHDAHEGDRFISGGIYCLTSKALLTLQRCMSEGRSRMRNFQRALIEDGLHLQAYPFRKILDVDHADDIRKAELFLNGAE